VAVGLRGEWLVLPACLLWLRVPRKAVAEGFCAEVERGLLLRSEDGRSSRLRRILHTGVLPGLGWRNITGWVHLNQSFGTLKDPPPTSLTHPFIWTMAFRHRPGPAFYLGSFNNGHGILYRPLDANRRSYSQQWNLTIERQLPQNVFLSVAYVANKGSRLPSSLNPVNVLNPFDAKIQTLEANTTPLIRPAPLAIRLRGELQLRA